MYGCAVDRQQASIVFDVATDMVRMCPALSKRVKILASQKRIIYYPTNSFYQVLSADAYSKHVFNVSGVIFDELHTQPNRKLFDVMTKGSGDARTQPLFFFITRSFTGRARARTGRILKSGRRQIPRLALRSGSIRSWRRANRLGRIRAKRMLSGSFA